MNCPRCDAVVDPASVECPQCGVILSKAHPESTRPAHVPQPPAPVEKSSSGGQWQIIAALVVVFGIAYAVRHRPGPAGGKASDVLPGWYADAGGYSRALSQQASTNQPVLVYFHTDWCGWCKRLDQDLFRTGQFNSRYPAVIKVKVNAERSGAERALASDFGVRGYPTVVVVRGGQRGEALVGYLAPDEYMARLDSLVR